MMEITPALGAGARGDRDLTLDERAIPESGQAVGLYPPTRRLVGGRR